MIRVHLTFELPEDGFGPHEVGEDDFFLPEDFAADASEARAKILRLIATTDGFELPQAGDGMIPVTSAWVRRVVVREARA